MNTAGAGTELKLACKTRKDLALGVCSNGSAAVEHSMQHKSTQACARDHARELGHAARDLVLFCYAARHVEAATAPIVCQFDRMCCARARLVY